MRLMEKEQIAAVTHLEMLHFWLFVENQKITYSNVDLKKEFLTLFARIYKDVFRNSKKSLYCNFISKELMKFESPDLSHVSNEKLISKLKKHFFFGCKIEYRLLMAVELMVLCQMLEEQLNSESIMNALNLSKKQMNLLSMTLCERKSKVRVLESFLEYYEKNCAYKEKKLLNVGICATMSAGKSTFVNALLGNDYLPVRNEATTAKIMSIYDNDYLPQIVGYSINNAGVLDFDNNLNEKKINQWNSENEISRIVLQSDLDNIGNFNGIMVVHDTPGTNNSGNLSHYNVTFDFLKKNRMDVLVYVSNVEHMMTVDEKNLLEELQEKIVKKQKLPVLFVVNKIDNLDRNKECSVEDIKKDYESWLRTELGYKKVKVLAVSAKAARIFKMLLKGKGALLTEKEMDDLQGLVRRFTRGFKKRTSSETLLPKDIVVGDETYSSVLIQQALENTGIKQIEKELENFI